jgi:hypothetical protein
MNKGKGHNNTQDDEMKVYASLSPFLGGESIYRYKKCDQIKSNQIKRELSALHLPPSVVAAEELTVER